MSNRDACLAQISYAEWICADIPDAKFADQPMPGVNHPAFLIGHLCLTADYIAMLAGRKGICPEGWGAIFDQKKPLSTNVGDYPSKAELLTVLRSSHEHAITLVEAVAPDALAKPHNQGWFEKELPTLGDMFTYLLIGHSGVHLGQLSAWRRMTGGAPLF